MLDPNPVIPKLFNHVKSGMPLLNKHPTVIIPAAPLILISKPNLETTSVTKKQLATFVKRNISIKLAADDPG